MDFLAYVCCGLIQIAPIIYQQNRDVFWIFTDHYLFNMFKYTAIQTDYQFSNWYYDVRFNDIFRIIKIIPTHSDTRTNFDYVPRETIISGNTDTTSMLSGTAIKAVV